IGENFDDALLLALEAAGTRFPKKGVLVSSGKEKDKFSFLKSAEVLMRLGIPMYATRGTAQYLSEHGFTVTPLAWPDEDNGDNVLKAIFDGRVDLVINIPKSNQRGELTRGLAIRQAAIQYGCPLLTNVEKVNALIGALERARGPLPSHEPLQLPFYKAQGSQGQ